MMEDSTNTVPPATPVAPVPTEPFGSKPPPLKYQIVMRYEFEAADDAEARQVVERLRPACTSTVLNGHEVVPAVTIKLQRLFPNKPPVGIELVKG